MSTRMTAIRTLHVAMLAIAFGTLGTMAIAAAIAFPTMKSLRPTLPDYALYAGEHHRIAAGQIMDRVFHAGDVVQAIGLGVALIAFVIEFACRRARTALIVRAVLVLIAIGVLGFKLGVLNPRMARELTAFREAARAGDMASASAHQTAFDKDHPRASALLYASAGVLALLLIAAAFDPPMTRRTEENRS